MTIAPALHSALLAWLAQPPKLVSANYNTNAALAAERRKIERQRQDATAMLAVADRCPGIDLEHELRAGRLKWDGVALHYTCGQNWPTEYRRAVASALADALQTWFYLAAKESGGVQRKLMRGWLPAGILARWFD